MLRRAHVTLLRVAARHRLPGTVDELLRRSQDTWRRAPEERWRWTAYQATVV